MIKYIKLKYLSYLLYRYEKINTKIKYNNSLLQGSAANEYTEAWIDHVSDILWDLKKERKKVLARTNRLLEAY